MTRAVAAGCDRLVRPSVADGPLRDEARRLIGVLLAGPFLLSAATWVLLPSSIGVAMTFGIICASFLVSGLGALAMAWGRGVGAVMVAALGLATIQISLLIAAAGGLASPVAAIAAALPVEAFLAYRNRRSMGLGLAALAAALGMQMLPQVSALAAAPPAIWHWLLPLAYCLVAFPRMTSRRSDRAEPLVEDEIDTGRTGIRFASNGNLLDVTPSAGNLLGLDPDLLYGTGFFERIHVGDRVGFLCAMAELRDGIKRRRIELRLRLPGQHGAAAIHQPLAIDLVREAADGESFRGYLTDNSEIAELRAALAAASDSGAGAEQAKKRFLAAVSHELRTPLNSIIGFSDMLLCEIHGKLANDRQREHVEIVREAGNHLLAVVNAILDVSKIEAGSYATNPEPFAFHDAAGLCGAMISPQAEQKGVALKLDVPLTLGEIRADRRAVQQMLINLLSNAVKFTPEGGEVSVGAKRIGSMLHFWVSDNGIGIASDDLAKLGTPFAQVQNDYTREFEGTGLGLALVKGLVSLHDGSMSIDSAIGSGTTVTIGLPVGGPSSGNDTLTRLPETGLEEEKDGALRKAS